MKFLQNFWFGFCLNDLKCSCITSHLHFFKWFMHFRCVLTMLKWYVLVGLDWAEPMMFLLLHVTCSCIFSCIPFFYLFYIKCVGNFLFVPLSLSLFLSVSCSMAPKRKSTPSRNPLRHLLLLPLLILPLPMLGSVIIKPIRTFWRTFHYAAFIRNAKSFYQILPILTFPLSSTIGVGSHYVASRSLVLP